MKKGLANRYGFTLIEAVLAAGVLAVLALAILELSLHAWRISAFLRSGTDTATELRTATLWVERDLRRANTVVDAGKNTLALVTTEGNVFYTLEGNVLYRDLNGSRKAVARGLTVADFSRRDGNEIVYVMATFISENGDRMDTGILVLAGGGS